MGVEQVIVAVLPSVVGLIQALFAQQNPGTPTPTSAEIKLTFSSVCTSSLAKDDDWLAAHPKP